MTRMRREPYIPDANAIREPSGDHANASADTRSAAMRVGETMDVALDVERVHFFDADTGESLTD